jgi:hypothetical protein
MNSEPVKGTAHLALRCRACARLVTITKAEVRALAAKGWLRCCGEVMSMEFKSSDGVEDER